MSSLPSLPRSNSLLDPEEELANGTAGERLRQLRDLLIGPEQGQIEAIRHRLDDPQLRSEDLSHSIAEAIAIRARQDGKLQATLQPLIEEALRISVARDPGMLATSLFPIIGEAVRKAVAHALQGMFDSLNQMLDRGFSLESWRWRFESWRSGKSYGEIALTRSLTYRVEQVFLIHRQTGLLIGHVAFSEGIVQDADLISGMLTAIQDFVRDSFGPRKTDELEVLQVGEFKLWLGHGPLALLAAVVSGQPPPELRNVFVRETEAIHRDLMPQLQAFDGDAAPLAPAETNLRRCLLGGAQPRAARSHRAVFVAATLVLLVLATLAALRIRDTRRWTQYLDALATEPGIVVVSAHRNWFGYSIRGLRDPLAADPAALLASAHIPPTRVHSRWEPYLSLDSTFDATREVAAVKVSLERQIIRFELNSSALPADQFVVLETVEDQLNTIRHAANADRLALRIEISGHTDRSGKENRNMELSQSRAESVLHALVERGIPPAMLVANGKADTAPQHIGLETYPQQLDRRVTFRVLPPTPGARP